MTPTLKRRCLLFAVVLLVALFPSYYGFAHWKTSPDRIDSWFVRTLMTSGLIIEFEPPPYEGMFRQSAEHFWPSILLAVACHCAERWRSPEAKGPSLLAFIPFLAWAVQTEWLLNTTFRNSLFGSAHSLHLSVIGLFMTTMVVGILGWARGARGAPTTSIPSTVWLVAVVVTPLADGVLVLAYSSPEIRHSEDQYQNEMAARTLPEWARSGLSEDSLVIDRKLNPFYQSGDFDGDGLLDIAILVRPEGGGDLGIQFLLATGASRFVGEGVGEGGPDLRDFESWRVRPSGRSRQAPSGRGSIELDRDSLVLLGYWEAKSEPGYLEVGSLLYLDETLQVVSKRLDVQ